MVTTKFTTYQIGIKLEPNEKVNMLNKIQFLEQLANTLHGSDEIGHLISSYNNHELTKAILENNGDAVKKNISNEQLYPNEMAVTQF